MASYQVVQQMNQEEACTKFNQLTSISLTTLTYIINGGLMPIGPLGGGAMNGGRGMGGARIISGGGIIPGLGPGRGVGRGVGREVGFLLLFCSIG